MPTIFLLALAIAQGQGAAGQAAAEAGWVLPMDTVVAMGQLSNGLSYYVRENRKPEGRVELRLIVKEDAFIK